MLVSLLETVQTLQKRLHPLFVPVDPHVLVHGAPHVQPDLRPTFVGVPGEQIRESPLGLRRVSVHVQVSVRLPTGPIGGVIAGTMPEHNRVQQRVRSQPVPTMNAHVCALPGGVQPRYHSAPVHVRLYAAH